MCVCVLCPSLLFSLFQTQTLLPHSSSTHPPHTHTDISLAGVSVCSVMRQRLGLANTSACHVTVCLPPSTPGFDMEIHPGEPGKPLNRDGGSKRAERTAESIKERKKRKKVLNLCLPFTAAGQGGRECRIKGDRGEKNTMRASNCVTLRPYQVLKWLKSSH